MRFAHIADTHVGYRQYNLDEREEDFYGALGQAVDLMLEERVDFVVHSGDLFNESRPTVRALIEVKRVLERLQERGVPVYIAPGNHEIPRRRGSRPPVLLFDGLRVFTRERRVFQEGDVLLCGLPYYPSVYQESLVEALGEISRVKNSKKRVLVLHQAVRKFLPFEGSFELEMEDLPPGFDYYALGHIHRRIQEDFGGGVLAYAGSTEMWRIDEYEDARRQGKGFYLVDLDGDCPEVAKVDLETRGFVRRQVKIEELDDVLRSIRALDGRPVVHLEVSGSFDRGSVSEKIYRELGDAVLHVRQVFHQEEPSVTGFQGGQLDITESLREYLEASLGGQLGEEGVDFAVNLFRLLAEGSREEAIELAERFYQDWRR